MNTDKAIEISTIRRKLFLLGVLKIPMIGYVRPKLLSLDADSLKIRVRLRRRTRNHLGSMYFGALAVGADLAAGVHAFYFSEMKGYKTSLAFKGIHGEFLKRAESDVIFQCDAGQKILQALEASKAGQERVNLPVIVKAFNLEGDEVATFEMILSLRVKS
jgi:acyl-coenzyme A thioesterase PaaI-like protein